MAGKQKSISCGAAPSSFTHYIHMLPLFPLMCQKKNAYSVIHKCIVRTNSISHVMSCDLHVRFSVYPHTYVYTHIDTNHKLENILHNHHVKC